MKVAVGSTNPVKVKAVEEALGLEVVPVKAESGVSPTPTSIEEMVKGAVNRAKRAFSVGGVVMGVGIEGGLYRAGDWWFLTAFAAVWDGKREGVGHGFGLPIPHSLVERTREKELGEVMEELSSKGVKEREGAVGVLTRNYLERKDMLVWAVKAAYGDYLRKAYHPEL